MDINGPFIDDFPLKPPFIDRFSMASGTINWETYDDCTVTTNGTVLAPRCMTIHHPWDGPERSGP